jgi:hypothetical protein
MPCIRGSEPSMHARPYQARQNQAKASHASEALSPACMHNHTRRGRAKPRREQGHEARAMHQRQRPPHASTAMHQRQRAQHACTAIRGEAEPSQGESEGVRPMPCIRGSEPSMHAQPYQARQSQAKASHASEALSPACMHNHTRRGRAKPRRERGHEARAMHQRQRPPHASTAMHQRQRAQHACTAIRGEAEPSQGESEGVRPETCIRGSEPSMHAQPYEARQSQAKARARASYEARHSQAERRGRGREARAKCRGTAVAQATHAQVWHQPTKARSSQA